MSLGIASIRTVEGGGGSVQLAVSAARAALDDAAVDPRSVRLLISAGVYRDENICEPAMAPFIQRALGIDTACIDGSGAGPFSFDVNDSACGVLTACQIAEQLLVEPGASALVLASDVDPNSPGAPALGFQPVGAAVVLRPCPEGRGFRAFCSESHGEHRDSYLGSLDWTPHGEGGTGEHRVTISQTPDFASSCADCGASTIESFLEREGLEARDIDVIVPAGWPCGFAEALREKLKRDDAVWLLPERAYPSGHTAASARCIERGFVSGKNCKRKRRMLFVAAGAGIKISLALYDEV